MTTLYKLTDENGYTYGGCQWGKGVEHLAAGTGELCGPGWLHAYTDPLLAVLLNPIHANFRNPRLWEAEGDVGKEDDGLKVGCTRLKTIREIPLPAVSLEARVRFGILCSKHTYEDPAWNAWADKWLSGEDQTKAEAWEAWAATRGATAASEAVAAAARGATAAAEAAEAAAWAAWAASISANHQNQLPFTAIARQALKVWQKGIK